MSYPVGVLGKFNLDRVIVLVSREIFSRWEIWKRESPAMFSIYLSAINSVQVVFFKEDPGRGNLQWGIRSLWLRQGAMFRFFLFVFMCGCLFFLPIVVSVIKTCIAFLKA